MDYQDIQNFANQERLDVRELEAWSYRLIRNGKYIIDVYIKKDKKNKNKIIKNTTFIHKTKKWTVCYKEEDLKKLI